MVRVLEVNYWKVIPGAKQHLEDPARKLAKFACKNLKSIFKFGCVHAGKYVDYVAFLFLWDSIRYYQKSRNVSEGRFAW